MKSDTPKVVPVTQLREQFDFSQYDVMDNIRKGNVIFFDGDTHIEGDLSLKYTNAIDPEAGLVFVNGNLTVNGDIAIRDYSPWLLVVGNVTCDVLYSGDNTIYITGDADVKYAFGGYYNDGSITVEGTTRVPYVLNSDHHSAINPEGAILINLYSDDNDFFEYDYTAQDLENVLIEAAFDKSGNADIWTFIHLLKAGTSPLKETARPRKEIHKDEIEHLTTDNPEAITELDLTDMLLTKFPHSLTKLINLKKLKLSENEIQELPDEIGELRHLEELHMRQCDLQKISPAIGKLTKLRILDISSNFELRELPASVKNLSNLQKLTFDQVRLDLPATFDLPANLEEISLYGAYKGLNEFFPFPMALTKLRKLKELDLRENKFDELPQEITDIQSLEGFLWTGSGTNADNFPDFTKFPHLKKLVISRKLLGWQHEVFNIPTLEHLEIDRNRGQKEYLDQSTIDIWLEMAAQDPGQFGHLPEMIANKKQEPDGRFSIVTAEGITPDDIRDLNKLPLLKYLDLSFNDLPFLPETIYELKSLEYIDLRYNSFDENEQKKIVAGFPGVKIEF